MGRRAASSNQEASRMPQGTKNPSPERGETQPECPHLEIMDQQNENPHPAMDETNSKLAVKERATKRSKACLKKTQMCHGAVVRRSVRFQDKITPAKNQNIEHVLKDITVTESESEDEQPAHKMHGPTSGEKSMEEKLDYVIQLLETLDSKARNKKSDFCENPASIYKSLYADSQKIEALANENHQLSLKLAIALAKLEAYEKGTHAFSEIAEKLKDMIAVSNLAKATETAVNLSSQTACRALVPQDEFLSQFLNRKRSTVQAPKAAAKRKKRV